MSESLRDWFVFLYMEARHLGAAERREARAMEAASEQLFADIIAAGVASGAFRAVEPHVSAGLLKALLQDWYLKRGKHRERGLTVTGYADEVVALMTRHLAP